MRAQPPATLRTAVKRSACAMGLILVTNFLRKILKENVWTVSQNTRKKIEALTEICKEKKSKENGKSWLFEQNLFKYRYSVDLTICLELHQKSNTLLKHRDLLACLVACNLFETT